MSDMTAAIRGGFAKRAAKGLTEALQAGHELQLVREPGNPYDSNAILVVLQPSSMDGLAEGLVQLVEFALAGHGIDWEEFREAEWPLGYVGKEWAAQAAPRMDSGEAASGVLGFDGAGKPQVEITFSPATQNGA